MAVPNTIEELLELIRKSNTVAPSRLDDYLAALSGTGSQSQNPKRLAARLVRDGLITAFQAEQFLQGRWKGFALGKYRILEKLGAGGMGSVFLCEHAVMNHRVAVKVLPEEKAKDPAALGRFYREARAAAGLDHPNIVRAYDIDQDGDRHFLVLEYVDGASLQELVSRRGPLDIVRAAHYIRQAAFGLQRAHEAGLVHRDVKPGNLLVDRAGIVKVADLGLARFFHDESDALTREHDDGAILGSADYFAPEQALDSHEVDIRGDIYALGCTFFFLLTGRPPFQEGTVTQKLLWHQLKAPPPLQELRPEVPVGLVGVVERMLAKNPDDRFQTPAAVAHALEPWTETPIAPPLEADFRRLSPAAQGSGSRDTGRGSSRTKITYPPIPEQPRQPPAPPAEEARSPAATFAWDKLDSSAISYEAQPDTASPSGRKGSSSRQRLGSSSSLNRVTPRQKQLVLVAAGLLAVMGSVGLWWGLTRPTRPTETGTTSTHSDGKPTSKGPGPVAQSSGPIQLLNARTGKEDAYAYLSTALGKAEPGDRIVVRADPFEELLVLSGDGKLGRDVTIEGRTATGQPVVWRPAAGHGKDQPLIVLRNTPGLRLTGFLLDGLERINDLLVLSERCPGLTLEGVRFKGFLRSAIKLHNCEGEPFHPVALRNVSATVDKEAESALLIQGDKTRLNQHLEVRDSRFVGRYKSAIRVVGALTQATFQGNRFFRGVDAFRFQKSELPARLHLVIASNTFAEFDTGLHWENVPPGGPGNHVLVQNNLFLKTKTLAKTNGVRTQPEQTAAQWIWFNEPSADKGAVPAESRYFRKMFDLPKGPVTRAVLEVACDDSCSIWLNGAQVGRSPFGHFTRHVYAFEVAPQLRAGSNVLAVQATNRADLLTNQPTGARLLVQLSCTLPGQAPRVVVSDSTWNATASLANGWQQPVFKEMGWSPAKVLGPYQVAGPPGYSGLTWDSAAQQPATTAWRRVFTALGNVRDGSGLEGYPPLESRFAQANLPSDPGNDTEFLRYAAASPLTRAGMEQGPVGAPPANGPLMAASIVLLHKNGQERACRTVRDALLQARPGERVVVRGDLIEEPLVLWGKDGFVGPVHLEGVTPTGKPLLWRVPNGHDGTRPLLRLTDLAGLTIKGFLFDGHDRVHDLLVLGGYCPNVVLEDVQLRGFRRTGLVLRDCTGLQDQPVLLRRLRTTTLAGSVSAVALEANPGQSNRFIRLHDCRFEGPYESALRVDATVAELEVRRNRFHGASVGILYKKATPGRQLHTTVEANTFCEVDRIVHFEAMPSPNKANQIVLRNNLFANPLRLVQVDGFEFEPKQVAASWIWFPDSGDLLQSAPAGTRFFRRSFELTKDKMTTAVLNLVCDDGYTVWLNGKELGKDSLQSSRRHVAAFDVARHLQPGKNVLAVEGRNNQGAAGLLVQLTMRTGNGKDAKERQLVSDSSWRTSKDAPPKWLEPDFADEGWPLARVVTSYDKPHYSWRYLLWQSQIDRQAGKILWPLLHSSSVSNVSCRNAGVTGGYGLLEVTGQGTPTSLGIDPDHDATYLRYARDNPLAQAGLNKGPVGVPPVE